MTVIQTFMHMIYSLQHYRAGCTAVALRSGHPVIVYGGSCVQAFMLLSQRAVDYIGFN